MADVFISYQRTDRQQARALANLLEGYGFSVWWDGDLLPGQSYANVIAEIIRTSRAAVVIWSQQSINSSWVLDEAARAREQNKLIPVRLGNVQPPMGFGSLHAHDLIGWDGSPRATAIEPLLKALELLVGRTRTDFNEDPTSGTVAAGTSQPFVDQRQSAAFNRWIQDFFWPFLYVAGIFFLISTVPFLIPGKLDTHLLTREIVKLVHVYAGMIILGGGVFVFLLFRLAARAPTRQERWACADAAKKLVLFLWLPTAFVQPLIGLGMIYAKSGSLEFNNAYFPRWIVLSLLLYAAAFLSWVTGFRAAWDAARADLAFGDTGAVSAFQFRRDTLLGVALACTTCVYGIMIYHEEFQRWFGN